MLYTNSNIKIGDCEGPGTNGAGCDKTGVQIWVRHNIALCKDCKKVEDEAWAKAEAKTKEMNLVIQESRRIDSSIQVTSDIFNAKTVPIIQLKGAIAQNTEIPEGEQKQYALVKEIYDRMKHLSAVVFDLQTQLKEANANLRMWQANAQEEAAKLSAKYRAEFAEINIEYEPTKPAKPAKDRASKGPKTPKVNKAPAAKWSVGDLKDAADRLGLKNYEVLRSLMIFNPGMTVAQAEAHYREMQKPKSAN